MHDIKQATGAVVAADTQASVGTLDEAVLAQARLCASVIEAAAASKMPVGATQKLLESMSNGIKGLVTSRSDLVAAVREINMIKMQSNLQETSYGCPNGLPGMKKIDLEFAERIDL
jgi:hypothetical protein